MSVIEYPRQSFDKMSRKQAITTCYALEDMRDRAVAELKRLKVGRLIEQTMLRNALPKLVALDRVTLLVNTWQIGTPRISTHWDGCHKVHSDCLVLAIRAALEEPS